jgi:prevent-host-death family protein
MASANSTFMSRRIPAADVRKDLASVLQSSSHGERIKVTRYNKTVGIVIGKKDLERLEDCEQKEARRASRRARPR